VDYSLLPRRRPVSSDLASGSQSPGPGVREDVSSTARTNGAQKRSSVGNGMVGRVVAISVSAGAGPSIVEVVGSSIVEVGSWMAEVGSSVTGEASPPKPLNASRLTVPLGTPLSTSAVPREAIF
jgi:hypothetical protein